MTILYVAAALACALHMMQRLADAAVALAPPHFIYCFFFRKNSCFKIHGMFLLTVISRAIFCGASFSYYSQIVSEASPNDSIPMFYKVMSLHPCPVFLRGCLRCCVAKRLSVATLCTHAVQGRLLPHGLLPVCHHPAHRRDVLTFVQFVHGFF